MKISYVDVQNYRKLKACRISLTDKETIFVGANNSGKTSAMDALIFFLDPRGKKVTEDDARPARKKLLASDFTLSNWNSINSFGESWKSGVDEGNNLVEWQPLCPSIDIWMTVSEKEIHRVSHIIPTLKWAGGMLGIRLIHQPKSIENIKSDFLLDYNAANQLLDIAKQKLKDANKDGAGMKLSIWPENLHKFLEKNINKYFETKSYILDPSRFSKKGENAQPLMEENIPLDAYPFNGLFKVDIIDAARGFSDPNSQSGQGKGTSTLSSLIHTYYKRHLNPSDLPDGDDLEALNAIADAQYVFDEKLNEAFTQSIGEIKNLGYPGFNDPNIRLSSRVDPIDNLDHETGILFDLQKISATNRSTILSLSEKYNGLGYKNLIAMIFKLISFRDHWMRVGKAAKSRSDDNPIIEPLHLVLIEEPEAHLHAQVQQVFIRKAYEVLRNHPELGENSALNTQLIVSTHSSYLAHEIGFECLRYFKRKPANNSSFIPTAEVADLSETFGENDTKDENILQTRKFVSRYLKSTHCDVFFANGLIVVEGAAERMLVPHFIRSHYDGPKGLNRNYLSILEVGGAHAHRLKALIEKLGIPTLIVTDTDALEPRVDSDGKAISSVATRPLRKKGYETGSHTLKEWLNVEDTLLDSILDLDSVKKIKDNIRFAYQCGIFVDYDEKVTTESIPYTFEDALALTNIKFFRDIKKPKGMLAKMQSALKLKTLDDCSKSLYDALAGDKAGMALDLLYCADPETLQVPLYIKEGLDWLQERLEMESSDVLLDAMTSVVEVKEK